MENQNQSGNAAPLLFNKVDAQEMPAAPAIILATLIPTFGLALFSTVAFSWLEISAQSVVVTWLSFLFKCFLYAQSKKRPVLSVTTDIIGIGIGIFFAVLVTPETFPRPQLFIYYLSLLPVLSVVYPSRKIQFAFFIGGAIEIAALVWIKQIDLLIGVEVFCCYLFFSTVAFSLSKAFQNRTQLLLKEQKKNAELAYELERAQIEEKLERAVILSAVGEVSASVAHEVRTPLTVIQGSAEQLKDRLGVFIENDPSSNKALNRILSCADKITKIVQNLTTTTRETKEDPYRTISLKSLFSDLEMMVNQKVQGAGIRLLLPEVQEDFKLYGREIEISQVLINLVNNAVDAVSSLSDRWIKVSIHRNRTMTEIRVVDSGSGISESLQEKIFESFFTTKPAGKGTGLGLALCARMAKEHGGSLRYELFDGHTCFVLALPNGMKKSGSTAA